MSDQEIMLKLLHFALESDNYQKYLHSMSIQNIVLDLSTMSGGFHWWKSYINGSQAQTKPVRGPWIQILL